MSFGVNVDVKVFSKGAGKRIDLWGVEVYIFFIFNNIMLVKKKIIEK